MQLVALELWGPDFKASLAQLAEHALRKRMVMGSIPIGGFFLFDVWIAFVLE